MTVTDLAKASATDLARIGSPILPGGTEAHVRKMVAGTLFIVSSEEHGLLACSPHWIVPAATVRPALETAGLALEPGRYQVFATGRSKEPKVHRLGDDQPTNTIVRFMDEALAATTPLHHRTSYGLPVVAASWDTTGGDEGWAYLMDADRFGLRLKYLDWLTGKGTAEGRAESGRYGESVYRIRAIGDVGKPVAVWVEEYLSARYISKAAERTIARRTCYVLMPARFPDSR